MPDPDIGADFHSGSNRWIPSDCMRCPPGQLLDFEAVAFIRHADGSEEALCARCLAADPTAEALVVERRTEPWCGYCYTGAGSHQSWCKIPGYKPKPPKPESEDAESDNDTSAFDPGL